MTDEIYKRLRPKKVEGVIGQDATTAAVEAKLSKGKWPHAAVFHGPSGTGKTTMARIVARRLGIKGKIPEPNLDYTEVNIAQTRGIDKVRRIVEGAGAAPLGGSPVRVWVLDEMHQMTKDGQNCVLKILEDPPEHAYFILCTTDPNKLVKAIRTRSTPFRFNSVKPAEITHVHGLVVRSNRKSLFRAANHSHASAAARKMAVAPMTLGIPNDWK